MMESCESGYRIAFIGIDNGYTTAAEYEVRQSQITIRSADLGLQGRAKSLKQSYRTRYFARPDEGIVTTASWRSSISPHAIEI